MEIRSGISRPARGSHLITPPVPGRHGKIMNGRGVCGKEHEGRTRERTLVRIPWHGIFPHIPGIEYVSRTPPGERGYRGGTCLPLTLLKRRCEAIIAQHALPLPTFYSASYEVGRCRGVVEGLARATTGRLMVSLCHGAPFGEVPRGHVTGRDSPPPAEARVERV